MERTSPLSAELGDAPLRLEHKSKRSMSRSRLSVPFFLDAVGQSGTEGYSASPGCAYLQTSVQILIQEEGNNTQHYPYPNSIDEDFPVGGEIVNQQRQNERRPQTNRNKGSCVRSNVNVH